MRVHTSPCVRMLASPAINWRAMGDFLAEHYRDDNGINPGSQWADNIRNTVSDSEALVEFAGRLCYLSFGSPRPGGTPAYIENIMTAKHGSVLEHANFTLLFTGVSRALTHELVRHRAGFSYSQQSQRFVDSSNAEYVAPPAIAGNPDLQSQWVAMIQTAQNAYAELSGVLAAVIGAERNTQRIKRLREAARSILPNAAETKIVVTANVRAWRHFLELRGSSHADAEIRGLAIEVHKCLAAESPLLFGDFEAITTGYGTTVLRTPYSKV